MSAGEEQTYFCALYSTRKSKEDVVCELSTLEIVLRTCRRSNVLSQAMGKSLNSPNRTCERKRYRSLPIVAILFTHNANYSRNVYLLSCFNVHERLLSLCFVACTRCLSYKVVRYCHEAFSGVSAFRHLEYRARCCLDTC